MLRNAIILGAAGRDFHNFNVLYRDDPNVRVVAFTATQIPNIEGRRYPAELAGPLYPDGIPIESEENLEALIAKHNVQQVDFAYSDVAHAHVMHLASRALAAGADFQLVAPKRTSLRATVPVVSVCAVRTGCGKSQTSRAVCTVLQGLGRRVVAVRHPMPYGDLAKQAVQRFATLDDLEKHRCTVEEREEYEAYVRAGLVVYAGVDYGRILGDAEREADVLVWDGGNNDTPFFEADPEIVVLDPLRAGHERNYHPGEVNLLTGDLFVVNKVDQATEAQIAELRATLQQHRPQAPVIWARSELQLDQPERVPGRRVLVVEDGPTTTHGGMAYGAGLVAAKARGAAEIVDPRPYAVGSIAAAYRQYPHLGPIIPALGYYPGQLADLEATLRRAPADLIVSATPVDLGLLVALDKPVVRVSYGLDATSVARLGELLSAKFSR